MASILSLNKDTKEPEPITLIKVEVIINEVDKNAIVAYLQEAGYTPYWYEAGSS